MKLVSLTLCRNAAWSIEAVVGHALRYCDAAVVLCHATDDGTQDILASMGLEISIINVADPRAWDEMQHRQMTLDEGRRIGGTHFLILDDDEICAEPLSGLIRPVAAGLQPGELAMMPMVCCWRGLDTYRSDKHTNPFAKLFKSTVFADAPHLSWKADKDGYQHHHTHPHGSVQLGYIPGALRWMHLQHSSWPRLVTKQVWYMAMEYLRYGRVKAPYARTMSETGLELTPVPEHWWPDLKTEIDLDARPWQADDIKRMVDEHGIAHFRNNGIPVEQALNFWT